MLRHNTLKIGGLLYVAAVFQFFVFELVAEALYPGYSVASNYISDLGATCLNPPSNLSCVVHQPTAGIFDATVSLMGLLLLAGVWFVFHGTRKKPYLVASAVADIAILLIGIFPENTGAAHAVVSGSRLPLHRHLARPRLDNRSGEDRQVPDGGLWRPDALLHDYRRTGS